MQEKSMKVYYGVDRLPYKDEQRKVHYPVVGNLISGENNTTKVYFYVGLIGGVNRQWVANIKKPDGTLAYQLLTNGQSVGDDYQVVLDISSLYADQVGEVKIGVQGYDASAVIVYDEETETYEISGNPSIIATGTISVLVNYAPNVLPKGETLTPTQMQLILSALAQKVDKESTILTFDEQPQATDYEEGQVIFVEEDSKFYVNEQGSWTYLDPTNVNNLKLIYVAENRFNLPTFENGKLVFFKDSNTLERWNATTSDFELIADFEDISDKLQSLQDQIDNLKIDSYIVVDTDDYPTLEDFLESEGEEGYLYLYPLDTSDLTKGYYRYVWENESWLALGTTEIDLSNYYTKTQVDSLFNTKASKVSVSSTGTATDEINYITIDGVEKKIAGSGGTGAVESVNGKTGVVVLTAQDIALENEDITIEDKLGEVDETTDDLQDQVNNLKSRGRYLSNWNATTGLPTTNPSTELPYDYRAGDYYIIGTVGTTNYKPTGSQYTGVASTSVETISVAVGDEYIYDGINWVFQKNAPINLDNYVDKTSDETVGGKKNFTSGIKNQIFYMPDGTISFITYADHIDFYRDLRPLNDNTNDIGSSSKRFKDLYLSGKVYSQTFTVNHNNTDLFLIDGVNGEAKIRYTFKPYTSSSQDLGTSALKWRNLYLSGKLSDGTNEITIANIQAKGSIQTSAEATYSGSLTSNNEYQFTTPLTSLNITSLVVASGDTMPIWSISFTGGTGITISLPQSVIWVQGTPTFNVGSKYIITIKQVGSDYLAVLTEY